MTIWSGFRGKSGRDSGDGDMAVEAGVWEYLSWTFSNLDETKKFLLGPIMATGLLFVIAIVPLAIIADFIRKISIKLLNIKNIEYDNKMYFGKLGKSLFLIIIPIMIFIYMHITLYNRFIDSRKSNLINYANSDLSKLYNYFSQNSIIDVFHDFFIIFIPNMFFVCLAILAFGIVFFSPYISIMIWKNYKNGLRGINILDHDIFEENNPKLENISRYLGVIFIPFLANISFYFIH